MCSAPSALGSNKTCGHFAGRDSAITGQCDYGTVAITGQCDSELDVGVLARGYFFNEPRIACRSMKLRLASSVTSTKFS
jgi:hypothetical protein